jgi:hypothetical protein
MHLPVLAITDRQPTCNPLLNHLEFAMNIELDEVVVKDVSDDALEMAACEGGNNPSFALPGGVWYC